MRVSFWGLPQGAQAEFPAFDLANALPFDDSAIRFVVSLEIERDLGWGLSYLSTGFLQFPPSSSPSVVFCSCGNAEMCEISELCELSRQDAMESVSVKGAMGGGGYLFLKMKQDYVALSRPGAACSIIFKI
jgi:hypothetical protein